MRGLMMESAVRAALIAFGTAAVLGMLRVKSAAARHAAWTGVVALMLLLPLWMMWGPRATLRVLPDRPAAAIPAPVLFPMPEPMVVAPANISPATSAPWNWLAIVYFAGASLLLARLALGAIRARTLTSAMCATPVTVGFFRPRAILPDNCHDWPRAQLDAVLVHEGEHVRRRDPLVQWLALLNRAIFWFHPLAWWLERHLSALAEEACDAAVLERGHDPHAYTGYLLDLARSVGQSGMRLKAVGMAMPGSSLPQRVRRILSSGPAPRLSRVRALSVALGCIMLSAVFAAASIDRAPSVPDLPLPPAPAAAPIAKSTAAQEPQPTPQKHLIALYFDLDGSLPDMQARANADAITLIERQAQANAEVAIMAWSNGAIKVLQDFTGDHDRIVATLQKLANNPSGDAGEQKGLLEAYQTLRALPDKKSLIYFAMPPVQELGAPLADIAIFPIDITGFAAGAQIGALIKVGDVLKLTLKDKLNTPRPRGVYLIQRADGKTSTDELNAPFTGHTFPVQRDGTVAVPNLGEVQAAGLTVYQLESTLGPALAARLSTVQLPITGVTIEVAPR